MYRGGKCFGSLAHNVCTTRRRAGGPWRNVTRMRRASVAFAICLEWGRWRAAAQSDACACGGTVGRLLLTLEGVNPPPERGCGGWVGLGADHRPGEVPGRLPKCGFRRKASEVFLGNGPQAPQFFERSPAGEVGVGILTDTEAWRGAVAMCKTARGKSAAPVPTPWVCCAAWGRGGYCTSTGPGWQGGGRPDRAAQGGRARDQGCPLRHTPRLGSTSVKDCRSGAARSALSASRPGLPPPAGPKWHWNTFFGGKNGGRSVCFASAGLFVLSGQRFSGHLFGN